MELDHQLAQAESLAYAIYTELNGQPLPQDKRKCAAIGCLTVAEQHHMAIAILLRHDMPVHAAAFALLRHQIEATFNALWLWYCASTDELEQYLLDGNGKTVRQLVAQLDGVLAGRTEAEAVLIRGQWTQLSDFVFSGERKIRHWLDANEVDDLYSEPAVVELVQLSNSIARLGLASYRNLYEAGTPALPDAAPDTLAG